MKGMLISKFEETIIKYIGIDLSQTQRTWPLKQTVLKTRAAIKELNWEHYQVMELLTVEFYI